MTSRARLAVLTFVNQTGALGRRWRQPGLGLNPTNGNMLTLPGGASNPDPTSSGSDNNHNRADELCYDPS